MQNHRSMRKAAIFTLQVIVIAIIFTALLYLWYLIDHGIKEFDWSLLAQGLLFSIIYVPLTNWWNKRKTA